MKVIVYTVRDDEKEAFESFAKKLELTLTLSPELLSPETVELAAGHDAIIFTGNCIVNSATIKRISDFNIRYISTRMAGYNNIDLKTSTSLNIKVGYVPSYSPNAVSEFTLLSALALIRNYKLMITKVSKQDFTLKGLIGKEIKNLTIGFIGAGRIGSKSVEAFAGLTPKRMIAYDIVKNDQVGKLVEYLTLDEVLGQSDIITLHTTLTDQTYHILNKETIGKIKPGAFIINSSRGGVIDAKAILEALNTDIIAGFAMDVYENEIGIFHNNYENVKLEDKILEELISHPKVITSPHYAFYTDEAVSNMVECSLQNIYDYHHTGSCINEIPVI